jgi:hypothetical protein
VGGSVATLWCAAPLWLKGLGWAGQGVAEVPGGWAAGGAGVRGGFGRHGLDLRPVGSRVSALEGRRRVVVRGVAE